MNNNIPLNAWINHAIYQQDFLQQVHGITVTIPNLGPYQRFFKVLQDRIQGYTLSHTPRTINSLADFYDLINELKRVYDPAGPTNTVLDRSHLFDIIQAKIPSVHPTMVKYALELVVGTWLYLGFQLASKTKTGIGGANGEGGNAVHRWDRDQTIEQATEKELQVFKDAGDAHEFSRLFTLQHMQENANFEFYPTTNLLDHLRVQKDFKKKYSVKVLLFNDPNILYAMIRGQNQAPIWHRQLAKETLNTLVLFDPMNGLNAVSWYSNNHRFGFDTQAFLLEVPDQPVARVDDRPVPGQPKTSPYLTRRISDYYFWKARLVILEDTFIDTSPQNILKWHKHLREQRVACITYCVFLLTLLVLIFGVISAFTGILTVKQAKLANDYSRNSSTSADALAAASRTTSASTLLGNGTSHAVTALNNFYAPVYFCATTEENISISFSSTITDSVSPTD